ncbi:hypothetical protein TWF225_006017 [Orbilia oligospora]|uniref:Uncharacterized protein n=1 Tax=Orbilia oligospora TaxID=2813651 RepID=A0A7C8PU10_ORBOL|nr:hypothetical protein TWF751_000414 [Orbilia oligospora]KAF3184339.1 hypothetical protein TWF225_006017 [Orbilia oligospora]KAF3253402.1 hypothetical protein TWF128_006484 [Orbilia oligospora]KAF3263358.1 hypothetical protein TWF217_003768 [Orbilia oligospora]KAF3294990.1 hypothetical protein TWF132_002321 [Orbilia oligospora]
MKIGILKIPAIRFFGIYINFVNNTRLRNQAFAKNITFNEKSIKMRSSLFSVAIAATLRFSVALASEHDLHFYPLEAREVGEFEMLGREMKKNGAPMAGLDITSDLERRGMSLNPRQSCPSGYGLCSSSGRCCRSPGRCCNDGTCIVSGETCCSTGGACRVARKCCGNGCIPDSSVCCSSDGDYCDVGYLCCRTGYCVLPGGECCRDYGTCRPGYRCVINSAGVRGCRAGTSGGGGSSIAAEPSSRGDSVSNSPSTRTPITTPAPDPTTRPSVEYRWFTTTIYWYYYWYYYVWVSTIDYTSTRSSRTSTSTTVSAYVSAFSAASRSFESIASDLTTSTPSQYTTEFEGPTPTPVEAATSSEASTAAPAPSNTGGSNSPGNDITNVGGGGGDNAPSTASQYRARDVLVFAPIVFLLTLIYML